MFGWGNQGPTPAQKQIGDVLFNDSMHVLSSFELNRIASLTYGDEVCDEIFEILEQVQSRPMENSVLTVQKSLVITKHILIYGSEKCVNSAIALQRNVEALQEFNTVLWAQKLQGAAAMMYKLKGGGVDKGFPVREAAKEVWPLMTDVNKLRNLRNSSADPNSLVPVGNNKVAFLSDDVRHYMLKKRIQEQYKLQTKSNLVKQEGGFGAGYASKDGKQVVGAAHGLEEMMKQAEIANRKFSDQGDIGHYDIPDLNNFMRVQQPKPQTNTATKNTNTDLLGRFSGGGANTQQVTSGVGDLLDFGAGPAQPQAQSAFEGDLLGTGTGATAGSGGLLGTADFGATGDLLGAGTVAPAASETISILLDPSAVGAAQTPASNGLLDFGAAPATSTTPAAAENGSDVIEQKRQKMQEAAGKGDYVLAGQLQEEIRRLEAAQQNNFAPDASEGLADPMSLLNFSGNASGKPPATQIGDASGIVSTGGTVMGGSVMSSSNEDRFSALDSLEVPAAKNASSILSAKEAESRLLGHTSSFEMPSANPSGGIPEAQPALNDSNPMTTDGVMTNLASAPVGAGDLSDVGISVPSTPMDAGGVGDVGLSMPVQGMGMASSVEYPTPPSSSGSGLKVAQTSKSSLNVSATYGGGDATGDDDDGFMMGGSIGSGLEPTASAPAAPPPPPPPM